MKKKEENQAYNPTAIMVAGVQEKAVHPLDALEFFRDPGAFEYGRLIELQIWLLIMFSLSRTRFTHNAPDFGEIIS